MVQKCSSDKRFSADHALVSALEAGGGAWEHSRSLESLAHTSYDRFQALRLAI